MCLRFAPPNPNIRIIALDLLFPSFVVVNEEDVDAADIELLLKRRQPMRVVLVDINAL